MAANLTVLQGRSSIALTLKDVIGMYLDNQETLQRSRQTCRSYYESLKRFCKYVYGRYNRPINLKDITTEDVEAYLNYLVNERNNSPRTRNDALKIISLFIRFCMLKGLVDKNITEPIEYARYKKTERLYLSEQETRIIFDAVEKPIIKLVLQTLYYTGMRIGELTELKLEDVEFDNGLIHIKVAKGDKERTIPLHERLKELLQEYITGWRLNISSDYLFVTKTGRISQVYISSELRKTLMLSRIDKPITPHTFRHTFASSLIRKGVSVVQVQKLLGHESLLTTGIYTHTNIDDLNEAVKTLNVL